MTREETLRKVKGYLTDCLPADCYGEVEEIIEALKQESVLDKIKAEIEQRCCITVEEGEPAITLYDVFQIIDKYKRESEEEQ